MHDWNKMHAQNEVLSKCQVKLDEVGGLNLKLEGWPRYCEQLSLDRYREDILILETPDTGVRILGRESESHRNASGPPGFGAYSGPTVQTSISSFTHGDGCDAFLNACTW